MTAVVNGDRSPSAAVVICLQSNMVVCMRRHWFLGLMLIACGSSPPASGPVVAREASFRGDSRTTLEQRRDAACNAIAPKLTECAREDAAAELAAGKVTKADFDRDTAPEILRKNTAQFIETCAAWRDISSRQVRVLEVCFKAEAQCGPLRDCLANLQPKST